MEDLKQNINEEKIIKKIKKGGIEKELLKEWENYYWEIKKIGKKMKNKSFINNFLSSLEKLIIFHLSSEGYK